jgi:hypothetical protein
MKCSLRLWLAHAPVSDRLRSGPPCTRANERADQGFVSGVSVVPADFEYRRGTQNIRQRKASDALVRLLPPELGQVRQVRGPQGFQGETTTAGHSETTETADPQPLKV